MSKLNIANYVVYDLANRLNCLEHNSMDNEIVGLVAENWHKKHFVSINKSIKLNHSEDTYQKSLI